MFYDPKAVTEMLGVLIEPAHLHGVGASRKLRQELSVAQYDDLLDGRLHEGAVAVLWGDFGRRYRLRGSELTELIVSLLTELYLISPHRLSEDSCDRIYDCSLLRPCFDFRSSWNERVVAGVDGRDSDWYALDFHFRSSDVKTRDDLTVCEERICPEGMFERFVTVLQLRQSKWRDFLRCGSCRPLQVFSNCLTDHDSCMVAYTDEAIRVLLRVKDAGVRDSVLHAAKNIRDMFLKMRSEFYESCVFFNEIVPRASSLFEFDSVGGVVLPLEAMEPASGRFLLANIELDGDDYVKSSDDDVVWVKALDNVGHCDLSMLWPMETHEARRKVEEMQTRRNFMIASKCLLDHMRVICRSLFRVQFISVMKRLQRVPQNLSILSDNNLQDMSKWRSILNEELVVESFSYRVPVSSESDGPNLVLAKNRDMLRVNCKVAGSSSLLSMLKNFEGAQQRETNLTKWEFRNTFVLLRLRSKDGAEGETEAGVWGGAMGLAFITVSSKPGCSFKYFDNKLSKSGPGAESEVLELRVEYRVPRVSFGKNRESVFRSGDDNCDVTALYKLLQDPSPSFNFCESRLTMDIADSVEGVFEAVRTAKASGRSLNLFECMHVLRILRNKIFGHISQFKIAEAQYVQAKAVLEYLAKTLEAYFGGVLEDESKPYFGGSGALSKLFRENYDNLRVEACRMRASLGDCVAPDSAMESFLNADGYESTMQNNCSFAKHKIFHSLINQMKPVLKVTAPNEATSVTKEGSGEEILVTLFLFVFLCYKLGFMLIARFQ